ncbi:hypothetical protein ACQEVB_38480 [Pseudonocardia sp. CA-107938]|uniref:hypothetical protein n=1 Tax=Pseudonocardia sp. CA-107938 TaxID=3240021 RepID=UPI003D8D0C14
MIKGKVLLRKIDWRRSALDRRKWPGGRRSAGRGEVCAARCVVIKGKVLPGKIDWRRFALDHGNGVGAGVRTARAAVIMGKPWLNKID